MAIFHVVENATGTIVADIIANEVPNLVSPTHHIERNDADITDLADLQTFYKEEIDRVAGEVRARYMSIGDGMPVVYAQKEKQAQAYIDAGYTGAPAQFPLLYAESQARGITMAQAADAIVSAVADVVSKLANIEYRRITARKAINSVANNADALAAKNNGVADLTSYDGS